MTPHFPRLHAVTNSAILQQPDVADRMRQVASPGIALHVRGRGTPGLRLWEIAAAIRSGSQDVPLFLNDRADIGLAVEAEGIHLPEKGLPTDAVRELVGPGVWIGRSVHSASDARTATSHGADYVFLGPIFETPSHPDREPLGVQTIRDAAPARVIAIGGIRLDRVGRCIDAGAYGIAAISAIFEAGDPGSAANEMLLLLDGLAP